MAGRKTNAILKVTNIRLSLERFEGNPILKPDIQTPDGRQKPRLTQPLFMKAGKFIFFIGPSANPMFPSWDTPPVWMGCISTNDSINRYMYRENLLKELMRPIHISRNVGYLCLRRWWCGRL